METTDPSCNSRDGVVAILGFGGCWGERLMLRLHAGQIAEALGARELVDVDQAGLPPRILATLVTGPMMSPVDQRLLDQARQRSRWVVACGDCSQGQPGMDLSVGGCPMNVDALVLALSALPARETPSLDLDLP